MKISSAFVQATSRIGIGSALVIALTAAGLSHARPAFAEDSLMNQETKSSSSDKNFKKMDRNANGTLSLAEFKSRGADEVLDRAESRFREMDRDGDRRVSLEEYKKAQKRRQLK